MEFVEFNGQKYKYDGRLLPMGAQCIRVADISGITADDDFWKLWVYGQIDPQFKLNKFNRDKLVAKLTGAE